MFPKKVIIIYTSISNKWCHLPTSFIIAVVHSLSQVWLCPLWTAAHQAYLSFTVSWSLLEFMSTDWVSDAIQLSIIWCSLLSIPSIFPSSRVFSNESALHLMSSKYWSFSFSNSPSSEYLGLISFRIDWFDLFAVQGTLKRVFSSTTIWKHQFVGA